LLLAAVLLPFLAACGASSSTSVTAPSGSACSVSAKAAQSTIGAGGGTGAINVDTARECQWSATADVPWLSVMSGGTGQGAGSLTFSAAPNASTSARSGGISINGQRVPISQDAAVCDYTVAPATMTTGSAGGDVQVTVTTQAFCAWTIVPRSSWVTAPSANGTGSADLTLHVATNTGAARSGTVDIAGHSISIAQDPAAQGCTFAIEPASLLAPAEGQSVNVVITAPGNCTWSAVSDVPWITFGSSSKGSGNGTVTVVVAANTGTSRIATVTIAGQALAVTQAASPLPAPQCPFAATPSSIPIAATGGSGTVTVTTTAGCAWSVSGVPSWLSATGTGGNGPGTVTFTAAANTGAARTATLTIGGQTVTVTQAAATAPGCNYSINPTSFNPPATGGPTTVAVTTSTGCSWNTTGAPPWIAVTNGAGTGSGSVNLTVQANTGAARTATLTIAGQPFQVTQPAPTPCTYAINPTSYTPTAAGGSVQVAVTAGAGCAWNTSGAPGWVSVSGGSGSGNGTVTLNVQANSGDVRTTTFTIAGQNFTVNQAAAACSFTVTPTAIQIAKDGGPKKIDVKTASYCSWTAAVTTGGSWITITSVASDTGNGSIDISIARNTSGAARTGTLTVAGTTVTVNQDK